MLSEQRIYIDKNQNDKCNGFYESLLTTQVRSLELSIPHTKVSKFCHHALIQPYKRDDSS